MNLYEQIGPAVVKQVITRFYELAFADPIIGHFFFGSDQDFITGQQIDFATAMLGGPRRYRGKPLGLAHRGFAIRKPHFGRRQVLMRTVLDDTDLPAELKDEWLAREQQLEPLIVNTRCQTRGYHS